ncbi:MAG: AraC family transcriptional regulator, partial [Amaricoccus sp.]
TVSRCPTAILPPAFAAESNGIDSPEESPSRNQSRGFGITAWTMAIVPKVLVSKTLPAVAKDLLRRGGLALDEVARQVGYGSASTFSTAFSRHVGQPPGRFMRAAAVGE